MHKEFTKTIIGRLSILKSVLLIISVFFQNIFFAQQILQDKEAINEIKDRIVTVHSIDPSDNDYSDLNMLIPVLRDVRIIGLGENRHDDGLTFSAKLRLIKFLHEKLGFEVVAIESSFYGGYLAAEEIKKGNPDFNNVNRNLPGWFHSKFVQPLFDYTVATKKAKNPLLLAGFDDEKQPNASLNMFNLMNDIYKAVDWITVEPAMITKIDSLVRAVSGPLGNNYFKVYKDSKNRYEARAYLKFLLDELNKNSKELSEKLGPHNFKILNYGLFSFLMTDESKTYGAGGFAWNVMRDYFMSKRIQWLTDSLYPGKKIILWAATGHLMRNNITIERQEASKYDLFNSYPYHQTGDYLRQIYGDQYYCIAFTSYQGEYGLLYPGLEKYKDYEYKQPVPVPEINSFEYLFHNQKRPYLFLDLRNNKTPAVLKKRHAHPLGYTKDIAEWHKIVDAFFFIDRMEPDVYQTRQ